MKNYFFLIGMIIVIISCNTKEPERTVRKTDSTGVVLNSDAGTIITDTHYFWSAEWDPKKGMLMKRTTPINADSLTTTNIINKLNELYPEIRLHFIRVSNDSLFVNINKSTYLTQHIGSSGAEAYIAEVTYNLTELEGINFVDIRFKEGDHATPGTYTRLGFVHAEN